MLLELPLLQYSNHTFISFLSLCCIEFYIIQMNFIQKFLMFLELPLLQNSRNTFIMISPYYLYAVYNFMTFK